MQAKIIQNRNAFLLDVDGDRLPLYGYLTYQPEKGSYEAFKQAGTRLFFCTVYAGDRGINQLSGIRPFRTGFWKGYGKYDFSEVDADLRTIVGASRPGEIYVILRLMVEVPSWWDTLNPDELSRDAHGTPLHQSFCSKKWLADAEVMLADLLRWLEDSGWVRYVIGWHIAAGNTEEFIRPCHRADQLTDYSAPAQAAFRAWLADQYSGSIGSLNAAWHSFHKDFSDVRIPSPAKRLYAAKGALRDPDAEREVLDYYAFMDDSVAEAVVRLSAAAKRVTGRRFVIGAFYGYLSCDNESGQHAAMKVFTCPDVDFIASPFVYTEGRQTDIDWEFQGSVASAALHGKPWFMEADVRTCLSRPISQCFPKADPAVNRAYDNPVWLGPDSVEGSLGQMLKAFSRVLTHNAAIWWFDMWGGWYDDPRFMAFHRKACEIYTKQAFDGGCDCGAEIALFMDDATFRHLVSSGPMHSLLHQFMWKKMGFAGAPYRMYMLEDLPLVDPDQYRMAIFASVCVWPQRVLDALEKWKSADRVLAFTGPVDAFAASGVRLPDQGTLELLPSNQEAGRLETPLLRIETRPGDIVRDADEHGALAVLRRLSEYSVYADVAVAPESGRIAELLNAAGGQIFTAPGAVAYASDTHIAVHTAEDGIRRIHVPGKAALRDEMTGQVLPGNESYIDANMKKGETLLLRVEPID